MTIKDPLECETARLISPAVSQSSTRNAILDCTISWRVVLVIILFMCNIFTFSDRAFLAVSLSPVFYLTSIHPISHHSALLAFYTGFMLTSIPGGRAVHLYGGKEVLLWAMILWSLTNMFTPLFIEEEKLVIISRLVLGLSEGLISPCIFHLLSTWFPSPELTRSLCVTLSGAEIGTAVALSLAGDFMHQPGWVAHFYVYGTIGMLWCITHWSMTSSSPEWHTQISLPEVQHITKDRPIPIGMLDNKHKTKVNWRRLFTHPTLLSIYTVHAIGTMVYNLTIAWLPTYCARQFEMTPSDMTVLAIFPCAVSMGVSIAGGWVCDYLIKRGSSRRKIRRTVTFIGFLVPAAGLQLIRLAPTFPVALAIITPSLSTVGLGPKAGYLAHILDVAPHHAGTVMGVADSISNIPCIFTTILIWRGVVDIKPFLDLTLGNSIMNAVGGLLLIFGSVCFSIGCSDEVILQKD